MQRLFLLVAVMLLSGCLTAPPKEAARPTLMPRAQSYKDLTHLPAPTGKIDLCFGIQHSGRNRAI